MDRFEEAVMLYVVANGETFLAPQFNIDDGWSCPDFVAIRPPKKTVYVVEVTVAADTTRLAEKITDRENQWFGRLRAQFLQTAVIDAEWSFRALAFVRRDQMAWLAGRIEPAPDVTVLAVEDAMAGWAWNNKVRTSDYTFDQDALRSSGG